MELAPPEEWYVFDHYGDPEIRSKSSDKLITALVGPSKLGEAKRIVACVNACAGIPNELLEAGNGVADAVRHFKKQRDEAMSSGLKVCNQLDEVLLAIPGLRYMDPPDGGDVSLGKQVRRMAEHVEQLETQRDELIGALEDCRKQLSAWMRDHGNDIATQSAVAKARAAIAGAKAGA